MIKNFKIIITLWTPRYWKHHGNNINTESTKRPVMSRWHGDAFPWWRHQMETFSALLAVCVGNSPVPVNFQHKGQWRGALMFSFICVWINDWVNNREAGDLRRHRDHYDVIVMRITDHLRVNSPVTGDSLHKGPVIRSCDAFLVVSMDQFSNNEAW